MSATHGRWCNAVTYPTKCPSCSEQVFFFRCDCNSAVFFDTLGAPWPEHDCETSWTRNLTRWKDSSGAINVELTPGVTVRRPPKGGIDAGVARKGERWRRRPDPIKAIEPDGETELTIFGVLREKRVSVDVGATLKLPSVSTMAAAFLGPLGKGRWGKVTVHMQAPRRDMLHSYTVWVPSEALSELVCGNGSAVTVDLRSIAVPGRGRFWVGRAFEVIG